MESFYTEHMNIKLQNNRASVFDGLVLREHVCEENIHKLINSDLLSETYYNPVTKVYANEKEMLQNYRRLI